MKIFIFYRQRIIVFFLIVIVFGLIITGIITMNRLHQNPEADNKTYEVVSIIDNEVSTLDKESDNRGFVNGKDILAKYSEVKGTDYAILVATTTYLETDRDLIAGEEEYPYIKYVIGESSQNTAETIIDGNNVEVILSFINYNAVIRDGCIFHKEDSLVYETPYGFLEEDVITNDLDDSGDNEDMIYKAMFSLKNRKNSINYINEASLFSEAYLVDINSKVIGSIYIEQGEVNK